MKLSEIIKNKKPIFLNKYPSPIRKMLIGFIKILFDESYLNETLKNLDSYKNFEFIDALFDKLNFSYLISSNEKKRIPAEGALLIVANHPLGALDGLSLLKAIGEVRKDVKVVANDVLMNIENINELILPIDLDNFDNQIEYIKKIEESLKNEEAVIIFPSRFVSKYILGRIRDANWYNEPINLANQLNIPILPCYINAKNSRFYYFISRLNKNLSQFMLLKEVLKKQSSSIKIKIGKLIPSEVLKIKSIDSDTEIRLLKKHVYNIGRGRKEIFNTVNTIIHPIQKDLLIKDLKQSKVLGKTRDNKIIYLVEYQNSKNLLDEIARLREITFRKVGEGTGKTKDFDEYDTYYKHIVVFDEVNLEIVGSYRLGVCKDIIENKGIDKIYNSEQFIFNDSFKELLPFALELGRSFVQMRYWGSNALDYLWQGIGAFLSEYPDYKYLFGAVSISDSYPNDAKNMIVYYHKKWFSDDNNYVEAKNKFILNEKEIDNFQHIFIGKDSIEDFMNLKRALRNYGMTCPVLLRKYVDLTEYGGTKYIDFGIDSGFANSIDCFVVVNLEFIKKDFKDRYYTNQKSFNQ